VSQRPEIIQLEPGSTAPAEEAVLFLLWHLGDVLNVTSLLPALAERHREGICFATTRTCVPILKNNPCLRKIFVVPVEIPAKLTFDDFGRVGALADSYFHPDSKVYNMHQPIDVRTSDRHIIEHWAGIVGLPLSVDAMKPVFVPDNDSAATLAEERYLVLANGGSARMKQWPMKHWKSIASELRKRFPPVRLVQLGARSDGLIPGVEDMRGKTSIHESYHVLRRSLGCLTNDSFMAHLSAAAGCDTYVIYGNTSPRHYVPLASDRTSVFGGRIFCNPCLRDWCVLTAGLTTCLAFPSWKEVFGAMEGRIAGALS